MTSNVDRKTYWDLLETLRWIHTRDEQLVAAMRDRSDEGKEVVGPFLAAITVATDPRASWTLCSGLGAFAAKLDPTLAKTAQAVADEAVQRTQNQGTSGSCAWLSVFLSRNELRNEQVIRIFRLLRQPLTAGEPTTNILALLEQVPGVQTQFGGDLWKAVEWAEAEEKAGRLKGLDLDAPLRVSQETSQE
jgi:hypothetical protein